MATFLSVAKTWLKDSSGRHPLFAAALVTVACVLDADARPWLGLAAALVAGCLGTACSTWCRGLVWLTCGIIATGVFMMRDHTRRMAEETLLALPGGPMEARLLEDGRGGGRTWSAPAVLLEGGHSGVRIWWKGNGPAPVAGSRVRAKGSFQPLPAPRNPGEFDRGEWMRRQGAAAVFDASRSVGEVSTGPLAAFGARIRHGFRERVTAGLDEDSRQAQVIRAVVIGEHPPDEVNLMDAFRKSGTLHVFSVSGLHVAMAGTIGWLALSLARVPRRRALPLLIALVFGYAWITGQSAPAVRAAWMAAVFLGAFGFRRKPDLLNSLGAVLLGAMLWDGRLLFQPGVQLSYGVVAAIAVGTSWAARRFAWMEKPALYMPMQLMSRWQKFRLGLRRKAAGTLAVSTAAGIGSAPLTAFHFGLVTPVSVLANLLLMPLVFILLTAALLSAALFSVAPPLSRGLNRLNGLVADACVLSARGFAAIPGGHFTIGGEDQPMLLVYDLDRGDGAACFADGKGSAVLLDCGGRRSFEYLVAPSLRRLGIAPDSVALSHPDGGHLGGGAAVWEQFPIRQALLPVIRSRSPSFREWLDQAPRDGVVIHHAATTPTLALPDGATLEVLQFPDPLAVNSLADDRVAVFRLRWRGWKILLTADAGMGTELRMLDGLTESSADVIIAGRHRNDLTLCDRFLDSVKPKAIIASNASHPEGEAVPPPAIGYWKSRGIQVIDQRESGGVTLRVDESGDLRIEGFLGPEPIILRR
jgi:ComEC/Rec2-related protein